MKIGILTLPLRQNYGGILQAYALQKLLDGMGFEVTIINREYTPELLPFKKKLKSLILDAIDKYYFHRETESFIKSNIKRSPKLFADKQLRQYLSSHAFDLIIVGSDQVWRPEYSPNISNFFLDFIESSNIRRIAYAASFGVDNWQFSKSETILCSNLAQKFHAVSVRERSGVSMCEKYLGVKAEVVLDPTFLLDIEVYQNIVQQSYSKELGYNDIFCYILDMCPNKMNVIEEISSQMGLMYSYYSPKSRTVLWSIEKWLKAFMNAKMIITDSYHGMVFSIIFRKPFWVIGNEDRGLTRFLSLLSSLRLEHRLIDPSRKDNFLNTPIDWAEVNDRLEKMRKKSLLFLTTALS